MLESEKKVINVALDFDTALVLINEAIRVIGDIFGPAFKKMIAKYALKFQSDKTGENPQGRTEDINEVVKYIAESKSKYPRGYNSLLFGIAKAEKMFEGATASGAKSVASTAIRKIIEDSGILNQYKGKITNIFDALSAYIEMAILTKATVSQRMLQGSDQVIFQDVSEGCPYKDACKGMINEGITRLKKQQECIVLMGNTAGISVITGKPIDYSLEKFDQPNCEGRIFEI
ncbi:MAG: hypothetical protein WED07_01820 [Candidatus Freyarchaeum deiterrae]